MCSSDFHFNPRLPMRRPKRIAAWCGCLLPGLLLGLLVSTPRCLGAAESTKPNILIILADDLGYGDVQCYNPQRGKIPTPNIDKLAAQGMRFTDGHSSSGVCSPSRYTLLTGRYHWRTRLQVGIVGVFGEPLIAPDRMTIGTLAKQQGYRTAAIGKWHLGWDWPISAEQSHLFKAGKVAGKDDEAPLVGGERVATAAHLAAWQEVFSKPIKGGPTTRGFDRYFGTDVPNWPPFCFIENDRTVGIPSEFLPAANFKGNLASQRGPALKQWPLDGILPTIGDRAVAYITDAAAQPEPFLLYLPLTAPHTPIAPTAEWKGKSGLTPYADFVMQTDATVGRVLDALDNSGAADRTLVLLTSDNGCAAYIGVKELEKLGHFPSGPLRGYKMDVWEGGHRIPMIARWPGIVKPGSTCGQLVLQADFIATLADIFHVKLPDSAGEDSFSLLPLLKGGDQPVRDQAVNCSSNGLPGVRSGSWKLVLAADPMANTDVQLYNLADDLGETKNLAADQAARVAAMRALYEKLIASGRSTPGAVQKNDVQVKRFPQQADKSKAKAEAKK